MSDRPTTRSQLPEPPSALSACPDAAPSSHVAATWSSTGSSLPHSYESSFGPSGLRFLASQSPFIDSGYDSVDSPQVLNLLATERDEELGTMFAMSMEDLPGNCDEDGPDAVSTPLRLQSVASPGLPMFHASPPPGTFRPLHPAFEAQGSWRQSPQSRSVSTQTPPGVARTRSSRARPRSAPLYEEREDSSSEKDEDDEENVFIQNAPEGSGTDEVDGGPLPAPLPDLLPERRPRSASVPALSRIYEQQVGEQLRQLGDDMFQERFAPRSLPNRRPLLWPTSSSASSQRRASLSDSLWDLVNRLVNIAGTRE